MIPFRRKVGGYSFDLRGLGSVLRDKSDSKVFSEMSDQLLLDVCSVFIRYVVQQVADTPCHMYLFCVLKWGQSMPVAGIHIGFTMLM